jgi:hypothetical protein
VVLENYWDRDKPIYPTGQIELQAHQTSLFFRNIFIREIPREAGAKSLSEQEKSEGFVLLFNGEDLSGWSGSTESYAVTDGKIVLDPNLGGGNLYTMGEYEDFVVRFEFRLTSGANNGLAIRAPLAGTPAYDGVEIQILDNTSPKYVDLKPYQFHGSIYGVVPAERGHLKPIGEWNSEQVTAKGRHITVTLNGATIVDADLDEASTPETMDEKDHPGLKREKGHIGFVGHGDHVEFRNIRIKVLN